MSNQIMENGNDEYDDDTSWFNLFAKLSLSIDNLNEHLTRREISEQKRLAVLPRNVSMSRNSSPSGTADVQNFGGPQNGREWMVRLLSAIAVPLAANAAIVTWYVGQNYPTTNVGQLPANMARWQFGSVPGFQNFTSDVIVVRYGEQLIAGLTSVPASSNLILSAVIDDQPAFAERMRVAIE